MPDEVLLYLQPEKDAWYLDATFGSGGHTRLLLEAGAHVIALDWDESAIQAGERNFADEISSGQLMLIRSSFSSLSQVLETAKVPQLHGALFDFGTSTLQLMSGSRGFSFNEDGPLDMRMDNRLGVTAADLLNVLPEKQLADLFIEYGGEKFAKAIAKAIKNSPQPITRTSELSQLIIDINKRHHNMGQGKIHPATRVFQALRIAVNTELDEIASALPQALQALQSGGTLVCIAFHEGEDRIVKRTFLEWHIDGQGSVVTPKPRQPSIKEVENNPRARSAKMRVFRKNESI